MHFAHLYVKLTLRCDVVRRSIQVVLTAVDYCATLRIRVVFVFMEVVVMFHHFRLSSSISIRLILLLVAGFLLARPATVLAEGFPAGCNMGCGGIGYAVVNENYSAISGPVPIGARIRIKLRLRMHSASCCASGFASIRYWLPDGTARNGAGIGGKGALPLVWAELINGQLVHHDYVWYSDPIEVRKEDVTECVYSTSTKPCIQGFYSVGPSQKAPDLYSGVTLFNTKSPTNGSSNQFGGYVVTVDPTKTLLRKTSLRTSR